MIKQLRIKFICINMTIVTAMLLVLCGMILYFTGQNLREQSTNLMMEIRDERIWTKSDGLHVPPEEADPGIGYDEPPPDRVQLPWFRVTWDERQVRTVSGGYAEQLETEVLEQIITLARESEDSDGTLKDYSLRFRKHRGHQGEQILFVDISSEIATMRGLVRTVISLGILSFGVFLLLSILLARWAVRPMEEAWNRQRQFVADASHELKTPLTVIMTNAELLQDGQYADAQKQVFSGNILIMSRQMRGLVERLLELARLDNSAAKMEFAPLDLSELVSESLLPFEAVYFEQQLQLESEVAPQLQVKGSASHLKQVLEILLDNGAKYTTPGGTVRVELRQQGSSCLLCVAGPGAPISREDLTNIFRRFYRVDKARSRDGSYGLGLSIAESIVNEHGGRIWAESSGGVNRFYVQLSTT